MPTVLVVDDSGVDRRLAGGLVERRGDWKATYAGNGKEALQEILRFPPDIVLTDLQMPEMNGLELVAAIKRDFPGIPVILMTSQGSEDIASAALQQGAASYVPKLNLADDLLDTLDRVWVATVEDRSPSQLMHYLRESDLVFVIRNQLGLIHALVSHLLEMLRCMPLGDETERLRVGLALEDALLNALYHGNLEVGSEPSGPDRAAYEALVLKRSQEPPYRDRQIHVHAKISCSEAVFVIRDEGPGFDPTKLPDEDATVVGIPFGRGVVLMRSVMDEVSYNDAGNEVTLRKRPAPEMIADLLDDEE